MLEALKDGPLNVRTSRNLLLAGLPHLLLGLPENEWLEVKSRGYQLAAPNPTGDRAKIELAQDVARFANGDCDAMLVIGFEETKTTGSTRLGALRPVPLSDLNVDRYRNVIDGRVVPPVEGLTIEPVDLGNNQGLLIIYVPGQPRELQPYLVHGAIAGDRTEVLSSASFAAAEKDRSLPPPDKSMRTSSLAAHTFGATMQGMRASRHEPRSIDIRVR